MSFYRLEMSIYSKILDNQHDFSRINSQYLKISRIRHTTFITNREMLASETTEQILHSDTVFEIQRLFATNFEIATEYYKIATKCYEKNTKKSCQELLWQKPTSVPISVCKIKCFFFGNNQRIFSTQNRYSNQAKWGTAYQSEFYADFKTARRFFIWLFISRDISLNFNFNF